MPIIETALLAGACLSLTTTTCTAPCWVLPATRLAQRIRIGFKRFVTGFRLHQAALNEDEHRVSCDGAYARGVARVLHALDEADLGLVFSGSDQVTANDVAHPRVNEFGMWKAAYRWSRRARIHFNMPTRTEANRIIVCDWLRKLMAEENVRPGQMTTLLPYATMLTFVKSRAERRCDMVGSVLASVPGAIDQSQR